MNQDNGKNESKPKQIGDYTSQDLQHLSDIEHVRKRPGMYIGDTGCRGMHHLIDEVVLVMLGVHHAGKLDKITVTIHADGSVSVSDDNTNCSLEVDKRLSEEREKETTNLEGEVAVLRSSGGKAFFGGDPKTPGSMFGVSVAVVNFLSQTFHIEACSETEVFRIAYREGEPASKLQTDKRTKETGTCISFRPDPGIFTGATAFEYDRIAERLETLAYLNAGLKTSIIDECTDQQSAFHYPQGIREYLNSIRRHHQLAYTNLKPIVFRAKSELIDFDVALQRAQPVVSYVNETPCVEGGTHLTSLFAVLADVLNEIGKHKGYIDDDDLIPNAKHYSNELAGMVSVRMDYPQWSGATKSRIRNEEFSEFAEKYVRPQLRELFDLENDLARYLVGCAVEAANVSREPSPAVDKN